MARIKAGERKRNLIKSVSNEICPRCNDIMEHRKHAEVLNFLKEQPYYYSEWDYCRKDKYVLHSEKYKVFNKRQLL